MSIAKHPNLYRQIFYIRYIATGAILAILGCDSSLADHVGVTRAAIVHGTELYASFRAVGVVRLPGSDPGVFLGTGTLIGRRTVLTAAHLSFSGTTVEFCDFPCGNIYNCPATCVSGTFRRDPQHDPHTFEHDVGLVRLNDDFTAITGIYPDRLGGPPSEGDVIEIIGYGCTVWYTTTGQGQKHGGINNVADINPEVIDYDDLNQAYGCFGDSGGPMLLPGTDCEVGVIGGLDPGVFDSDFGASRVDTKIDWILSNVNDNSTVNDPSVNLCGQTTCGDTLCMSPENCSSCPQDCGTCGVCGDGVCSANESCAFCPADCGVCAPYCGDGICNGGEDSDSCLVDCPVHCPSGQVDCCGDGNCMPRTTCQHVVCDG